MASGDWIHKPATGWQTGDIVELAQSGPEEGPYLEFKKASEFVKEGGFIPDKLSNEVAETVSAFLNSDGGVLLLGVQTERLHGDRKAERLMSVSKWTKDNGFEELSISLTSSQLRDLIYGNILPRPFGIEVKELPMQLGDKTTTKVFVVTVPPSSIGAHQSNCTKHYYRRTGDGDVPMLDYEIRDVNNRRAGPFIYVKVIALNDQQQPQFVDGDRLTSVAKKQYPVTLVFLAQNKGRAVAQAVRCDFGLPVPCASTSRSPCSSNHNTLLESLEGRAVTVVISADAYSRSSRLLRRDQGKRAYRQEVDEWRTVVYLPAKPSYVGPLWAASDLEVQLERLPIECKGSDGSSTNGLWIPWRVFAEGMREVRGAARLCEDSTKIRIANFLTDETDWAGQLSEAENSRYEYLKSKFNIIKKA